MKYIITLEEIDNIKDKWKIQEMEDMVGIVNMDGGIHTHCQIEVGQKWFINWLFSLSIA